MSPRPFSGIDFTIYRVRSAVVYANPRFSGGEIFNVEPSIKGVEVVHVPGGC